MRNNLHSINNISNLWIIQTYESLWRNGGLIKKESALRIKGCLIVSVKFRIWDKAIHTGLSYMSRIYRILRVRKIKTRIITN